MAQYPRRDPPPPDDDEPEMPLLQKVAIVMVAQDGRIDRKRLCGTLREGEQMTGLFLLRPGGRDHTT